MVFEIDLSVSNRASIALASSRDVVPRQGVDRLQFHELRVHSLARQIAREFAEWTRISPGISSRTGHNVLDISEKQFGQFDIVPAPGLLYHVADPYRALVNCASLSRDRLLIESYCIDSTVTAAEASMPIMKFIPDCDRFPEQGGVNRGRSNFWGFTSTCMQRMVEEVGFAVKGSDVRGDRVFINATRNVRSSADTRQGIAYGVMPRIACTTNADDPASWILF